MILTVPKISLSNSRADPYTKLQRRYNIMFCCCISIKVEFRVRSRLFGLLLRLSLQISAWDMYAFDNWGSWTWSEVVPSATRLVLGYGMGSNNIALDLLYL